MQYSGIMLIVRDMAVSRHFYEKVLRQKPRLDLESYVVYQGFFLMTEEAWREYSSRPDLSLTYGNNVSQLGFDEEDLDEFMAHLRQFPEVESVSPVREYAWGQRSLRFYDPDRHIVEVGEDMKVVAKRFLRSGMSAEETRRKMLFPLEFVLECQKELEQ